MKAYSSEIQVRLVCRTIRGKRPQSQIFISGQWGIILQLVSTSMRSLEEILVKNRSRQWITNKNITTNANIKSFILQSLMKKIDMNWDVIDPKQIGTISWDDPFLKRMQKLTSKQIANFDMGDCLLNGAFYKLFSNEQKEYFYTQIVLIQEKYHQIKRLQSESPLSFLKRKVIGWFKSRNASINQKKQAIEEKSKNQTNTQQEKRPLIKQSNDDNSLIEKKDQ